MSKNDGGAAFPPNAGWRDSAPNGCGMTLRDYMAGQALMGLLGNTAYTSQEIDFGEVARHCYIHADAMLEARDE